MSFKVSMATSTTPTTIAGRAMGREIRQNTVQREGSKRRAHALDMAMLLAQTQISQKENVRIQRQGRGEDGGREAMCGKARPLHQIGINISGQIGRQSERQDQRPDGQPAAGKGEKNAGPRRRQSEQQRQKDDTADISRRLKDRPTPSRRTMSERHRPPPKTPCR